MKGKSSGFFWPSFTDLMTSMFFIMLVLFVLSYARLKIKVDDLDKKLRVYNLVEENLKPLKKDSTFFLRIGGSMLSFLGLQDVFISVTSQLITETNLIPW